MAALADDEALEVEVAAAEDIDPHAVDLAIVSSRAAREHRFGCPIVVYTDDPGGAASVPPSNDVVGLLHRATLTIEQLNATVHAAAAGLRVNGHVDRESSAFDARALRLLDLMADGHSTREIADRMSYSERTIKKLITSLEERLQARSRAQLVALAIRRGLI
jgi:DNA-binding CsgD family transcriptional regulator